MSNYSSSEYAESPNTPWYKALRLIPDNSTVLDIGCSSGNFGHELISKKKCTVDGVELDEGDVAIAKTKLRKVYTFNIEQGSPKILHRSYDIVYYGDVIEHLVNPVNALKNTKEILKKEGRVVFSIPNMAHMSVRMMVLAGTFEYGKTGLLDTTHLHYYTKKEIQRIFAEAGYVIEKLDWVRRDVPKEILTTQLGKIGLRPSQEFFRLSQGVNAAAYQYIGEAKVGTIKQTNDRPSVSPRIDEFERHVKALNKEHRAEIERIRKHYENLITTQKNEYDSRLRHAVKVPDVLVKAGKKILRRGGKQ